jgi:transcriptional regulator with XRE-family HTH domain
VKLQPEAVQRWLGGTPPNGRDQHRIQGHCGYDFDRRAFEEHRQAMLDAHGTDTNVRALLGEMHEWDDLRLLFLEVLKEISSRLAAFHVGIEASTLATFAQARVNHGQRLKPGGTILSATSFVAVVTALPRLLRIVRGEILDRTSPPRFLLHALKVARLQKSMSKTDLARALDVSVEVLTKWEEKPDKVAYLQEGSRNKIAAFLEIGDRDDASSTAPVRDGPHAPAPPPVHERTLRTPAPAPNGDLGERVSALEHAFAAHCRTCGTAASHASPDGANAPGSVPHIFSSATYQPLPMGTTMDPDHVTEAQHRLRMAREALLRVTELPTPEERQRVVRALAADIDEMYLMIIAVEDRDPTAIAPIIDENRAFIQRTQPADRRT